MSWIDSPAGDAGSEVQPARVQSVSWLRALMGRHRWSVLRHYWMLRRSGLFEKKWYLRENPDIAGLGVDPLLHYLLIGGREGRKPNPLFDSGWYLHQQPDVAASGVNPLLHFLLHGAAEGRDPGEDFVVREYLAQNPDVAEAGINPLVHYLRFGRAEKRTVSLLDDMRNWRHAPAPVAPDDTVWQRIAAARPKAVESPEVDIVIPVYSGYDDSLACLYSVLVSENRTPGEVVVIDDCSPDRKLSEMLARLAELGLFTLIRNDRNLGFVRTANIGMKLHTDRDVVLLNADTVVYGNWLDRLLAHGRDEKVGTVTPLSTNATICSYPMMNRNNAEELEVDFAEVDRISAEVNAGRSVDVPTGVGFCMFVRRKMLDEVGFFDEEAFARGYGEENDLCRRAAAASWRNLMAGDVFVRHTGEVSFAETAREAQKNGLQALARKHPDYMRLVKEFCEADPAEEFRRRIDIRRATAGRPESVLFVSHTWGGGVDKHMRDLSDMLERANIATLMMRPRFKNGILADISSARRFYLPNLRELDIEEGFDEVVEALRLAGVTRIHVHSLAGWDPRVTEVLPRLAHALGVPLDFTFHDYLAICPRITMVDGRGVFCGGPEEEKCRSCVKENGSEFGKANVGNWLGRYERFLSQADLLFAPSNDVAKRISEYFPKLDISVKPHVDPPGRARAVACEWKPAERLRVAIIGAIGKHKGSNVLARAAKHAAEVGLPVDFVVIGYTDRDAELERLPNVTVTGIYARKHLYAILEREKCHLALIPSVWPETYCYTLSEALAGEFPVALFPIGAPYDRLMEIAPEAAIVLPEAAMLSPERIGEELLSGMKKVQRPSVRATRSSADYTYSTYYEKEGA